MSTTILSVPRYRLPLPTELLHWILQDAILDNIHRRLTLESGDDLAWNSLVVLPQVCHVFRATCLHICECLLGDPTEEQLEGSWHAKSVLQHACDAVEHLFRFSPSRLPLIGHEDVDAYMISLLHKEYRAEALQLPGLLGKYEAAVNSRLIRVAAMRRGLVSVQEVRLTVGASACFRDFMTTMSCVSRCGKLKSPQLLSLTTELLVDWMVDFYGFTFWITACCFHDFLSTEDVVLSDPGFAKDIIDSLGPLRDAPALFVFFGMKGLKFLSSLRVVFEDSVIVSVLEELLDREEDDPYGVKLEIKELLDEWQPLLSAFREIDPRECSSEDDSDDEDSD